MADFLSVKIQKRKQPQLFQESSCHIQHRTAVGKCGPNYKPGRFRSSVV